MSGKGSYNKTALEDEEDVDDEEHAAAPETLSKRRKFSYQNLLKIQFALIFFIGVSTALGFYWIHHHFTLQQHFLREHLSNLTLMQQMYNKEMHAFANGQFADFFAENDNDMNPSSVIWEEGKSRRSAPVSRLGSESRRDSADVLVGDRLGSSHRPPATTWSNRRKMKRIASVSAASYSSSDGIHPSSSSKLPVEDGSSHPNTVQTDTEYVWLTSHSRIPVCSKSLCLIVSRPVKDSCQHEQSYF
jgi:hypothetical protein